MFITCLYISIHLDLHFSCEVEGYDTCMNAPCPPPKYLHLLCDVNIGNVPCTARAQIFERCLHNFRFMYIKSKWNTCLNNTHKCDKIVDLLIREKLIDQPHGKTTDKVTTVDKAVTNGTAVETSSVISITTLKPDSGYSVVTVTVSSPVSSSTVTMGTSDVANAGAYSYSYIYAVIGSAIILIEFVTLCV